MTLRISSRNNDPDELDMVEIIKAVCEQYVVPIFTDVVVVEKGAIPHSHPILTLNTRVKDPRLVLKVLVHEQLHWYVQKHPKYNECIAYLKSKYKDDGEHNKSGTYPDSYWEHIIVCFNTRRYLTTTLLPEDLRWISEQWRPYPTLEDEVIERDREIESDLIGFDMVLLKALFPGDPRR